MRNGFAGATSDSALKVIYDEDADDEFLGMSKFGGRTIRERHLKDAIMKMQGTDIGTYEP